MNALNSIQQHGLRRACEMVQGHAERWQRVKERGATDDELYRYIGQALGLRGGGSLSDGYFQSHKGGADPEVRIYKLERTDEGTETNDELHLRGKRLVRHVRAMYNIPTPGQPGLFQ